MAVRLARTGAGPVVLVLRVPLSMARAVWSSRAGPRALGPSESGAGAWASPDRGRDHGVRAIRVRARAGPGLKGGDVDEVVKGVRRDERVRAEMKGGRDPGGYVASMSVKAGLRK